MGSLHGTVKWFNQMKGFGFIECDEGADLFVHKAQVSGTITDGDDVEYDIGEGDKGPNAINVRKLNEEEENLNMDNPGQVLLDPESIISMKKAAITALSEGGKEGIEPLMKAYENGGGFYRDEEWQMENLDTRINKQRRNAILSALCKLGIENNDPRPLKTLIFAHYDADSAVRTRAKNKLMEYLKSFQVGALEHHESLVVCWECSKFVIRYPTIYAIMKLEDYRFYESLDSQLHFNSNKNKGGGEHEKYCSKLEKCIRALDNSEGYLEFQRNENEKVFGIRETSLERGNRIKQDSKRYVLHIPELLVSAYSDQLIEEDELLRLWKAMGCPEPEQLDKSQISNSQVVIDVLSGESVVPASLKKKEPTVSEQLAEIERLYLINPLMPGYCSSRENALGKKDISSLEKMNENHPLLLDAVLNHKKKEWTAESAIDLLDVKGFEDHPDAVIEVLEGGHWKAAAIKRDLLQL